MKVFVAGATGVLGRRVVPLLVEAGHEVVAVARSDAKAAALTAAGARPVAVDLFDPVAVRDTVAAAAPEAVVNLATHIPPLARAAVPGAWDENDRIRTEASRNLVDAALAAGAAVYVQESITFPYVDLGDEWIDEGSAVDPGPVLQAALTAEAEAARFGAEPGRRAVVLRFAMFYGPDSNFTQDMLRAASLGFAPVVGPAEAYQSSVHLDDAAAAVVAGLGAPGGTYNVVDDEPLTRAAVAHAFAAASHQRRHVRLPAASAKLGGARAEYLTRSQRVSNRKLKSTTGWAPRHPSLEHGLPLVAAAVPQTTWEARRWMARRVALALLAVSALQVGVWAALAPESWFASFPGLGLAWTAADGPYNEHLSRDVGNLFLALAVVTVAAAVRPDRFWVRATALGWLVLSIPHLTYHALHFDVLPAWSSGASLLALALTVALPAWLATAPEPAGRRPGRRAAQPAHVARPA